jgi:predicted Zn-dependent protease
MNEHLEKRRERTSGRAAHGAQTVTVGLVLVLALAGCETTTSSGAVGVDRQQFMLISAEQLDQVAGQTYNKLAADATKKGELNSDPAMTARVRAIAARIEPQTRVFRPDAVNWNWQVNVIDSKELNAFCMPGGRIMFYSGLIKQLNLTDDEIAIVMGHEIAHALREHSREQISQQMAAQTGIGIGAALLGVGQAGADLADQGYQSLVATKFSRTDETEADRIGLELAARAGYDPRAGLTLWKKMGAAAAAKDAPPEFVSTHPADVNRTATIQSLLPKVMPLYDAAKPKTSYRIDSAAPPIARRQVS